ncbi:angiopoietin-related protein 7-like isoform X1 [Mytilus californianus]|uniref:angiopoietin-related protein 7-like isoform X1 n=1 Tax=Mytilus californianus TaxID=6549 RepID=UPI002248628C|nr:angiopoietin-related protein 7-like isoform X1 [Mytilus californianus]
MKDHTPLFVMFIVVVLTMPTIIFAKPYNNSVSDSVKMPLVSNELKAPLVVDLDASALNAQLKDYIDDNIVSTFTEKMEDIVNKKLLELKDSMLNEYSSKLAKSNTRYNHNLSEMHTDYENKFSDLSENQTENVTKFMENVQEWQNTIMQSMNEQSEYLQKSKIVYENQVSEILGNYRDQTSQISKGAITNFTDLKTDMEEWKNYMVADLIKSVTNNLTQFETNMIDGMDIIKDKLERIQHVQDLLPEVRECSDLNSKFADVYNISLDDSHTLEVRCETGGWTVIQKRFNGVTEFYRNWQDYENGFGDLNEEFWLGNKYIALLTSRGKYELRIDLEDWNGEKKYALYKSFKVGDQSTKYKLTISGYSGNAGDSMTYHTNVPFSTYDRDNDARFEFNCAAHNTVKGAWWYKSCWKSSLNGKYSNNSSSGGIKYEDMKGSGTLKKSSMMIKRT